jgi:hypothetical protein
MMWAFAFRSSLAQAGVSMHRRMCGLAAVILTPLAFAQPAFFDFEKSEGYSLGAIGGQQEWTEFDFSEGAGADVVDIDGRRALRLSDNPGVPNGSLIGGLSPETFDPGKRGSVALDVRIDDLAGASYTVVGQSLEQFALTFRVVFEFGGTIFVADQTDQGFAFVDTNVFFTRGAFEELRVEWAPGSTRFYYAGEMIYESTYDRFAAGLDQIVLASDGWQDAGFPVGDGPIAAYFDNIVITAIPAPAGAWIAFASFGLGALRRRPRYAGGPCAP